MIKAIEYLRFLLDFFVLRKERPYVLGLAITDICNLNCMHCRVANTSKQHMPYNKIKQCLEDFYSRGARMLYVEGGEPYLWRDGHLRLGDIVRLAKHVGYLRVHVYTNGTMPLDASPDFTWVSIDGLSEMQQKIRGAPLGKIVENIQAYDGPFAIVYTVNSLNKVHINDFLHFVRQRLPGRKVMFFFHTPYYGFDELLLSPNQKREAIDTIMACKTAGLPVLNSKAGLQAILSGRYKHPSGLWYVVDNDGEYRCCRAYGKPEVCENCGYSSCAEIIMTRSFSPGAMRAILRAV